MLMAERKAMMKTGWTKEQADRLHTRHLIDKMVIQMKKRTV